MAKTTQGEASKLSVKIGEIGLGCNMSTAHAKINDDGGTNAVDGGNDIHVGNKTTSW